MKWGKKLLRLTRILASRGTKSHIKEEIDSMQDRKLSCLYFFHRELQVTYFEVTHGVKHSPLDPIDLRFNCKF